MSDIFFVWQQYRRDYDKNMNTQQPACRMKYYNKLGQWQVRSSRLLKLNDFIKKIYMYLCEKLKQWLRNH